MHKSYACILSSASQPEEKREKERGGESENVCWFLIGCLLLIGEFIDWVGYLFFLSSSSFFSYACKSISLPLSLFLARLSLIQSKSKNPHQNCASKLRDLSSFLTGERKWKRKTSMHKSRCWVMQAEEYCQIRSSPSFMRTWTLITQYDCYSQRYAQQQQQQHRGRHPSASEMRLAWVNAFLSLSLSLASFLTTSILIKMTIITGFFFQSGLTHCCYYGQSPNNWIISVIMISSHTWEALLMETTGRRLVLAEENEIIWSAKHLANAEQRLIRLIKQKTKKKCMSPRWTNAFRTIKQREYKEWSSLLLFSSGLPCSFSRSAWPYQHAVVGSEIKQSQAAAELVMRT